MKFCVRRVLCRRHGVAGMSRHGVRDGAAGILVGRPTTFSLEFMRLGTSTFRGCRVRFVPTQSTLGSRDGTEIRFDTVETNNANAWRLFQ